MDHDQTTPDDKAETTPTPGAVTPDPTPDPRDPYSRRRFLRAAVIGAAGVAGAAGAAGVVLANGQLPAVIGLTGANPAVSFHDPGCSGCLTDSSFSVVVGDNCGVTSQGITFHNGNPSPGDFELTFTAPNLPAGSYYVSSLSIDSHFSPAPSNPYYREILTGGTAKCCPTSGPGTDNGASLDDINLSSAHPTTFTGTGTHDLVLHVHIQFTGSAPTSSGQTYTFSATFSASGQATAVCSETVTATETVAK